MDLLSQRTDAGRLCLAYAVPDRYERRSYSQGFGETVVTTFTNPAETRTAAGIVPIPSGGAVVTDDDVNALRDELGI